MSIFAGNRVPMQDIHQLLQKMNTLAANDNGGTLETDLMMDYTRRLYDMLLERKNADSPSQAGEIPEIADETITHAPFAPQIEKVVEPITDIVAPTKIDEREHMMVEEQLPAVGKHGDIHNKIGINDKYQFISELFGSNKQAYEQALDAINTATDMQQALLWLDENAYQIYNWDVETEAVQTFYGILTSFFSTN